MDYWLWEEILLKTAVITGATGAIGRALIKVCLQEGYDVLAVVHRSSSRANELDLIDHCQVFRLDLSEYDDAMIEIEKQEIRLDGYEIFFHLAWMASFGKDRDNLDIQLENIKASLAAVRFAKKLGCTTFVGTGSQAEYGRTDRILSPDTPTFPETGYGITKLCAGQLTRLSCNQFGLRHIWCRVLSVYGPYDRDQTLISTAVIKMIANKEVELTPCDQLWDYIYSDDAARAILIAGQKGDNGKIYVIGSGEIHPLKEYIEKIAAITGYTKEIGFGKLPYNVKQVTYLQADIKELNDLCFAPEISFEKGIEKMMQYISSKDH
jgi:nucleoside-diphosphate-sugar epimerase